MYSETLNIQLMKFILGSSIVVNSSQIEGKKLVNLHVSVLFFLCFFYTSDETVEE